MIKNLLFILALVAATPLLAQTDSNGMPVQQERRQHGQHPHGQRPPMQNIDTTGVVTLTKAKGEYIINTTKLCYDFRGYRGPTPLEIRVQKDKVVSVKALRSLETPKYYKPVVEQMLPKYEGKKVKEAIAADVDIVTGATFSSKAVKENVRRGLEYYQKNK